jgi:hypothetical protein
VEGSFEHRKEPAIYLPGISRLVVQALASQEKLCPMKLVILSLIMVVYVVNYVSTFEAMECRTKYKIALDTNWEDGTSYRAEIFKILTLYCIKVLCKLQTSSDSR